MAYEPTNWQAGDIVTSAKLNKMEQGIAKCDVVECIMDNNDNSIITFNKTWQEIWDNNYTNIVFTINSSIKEFTSIQELALDNGTYSIGVVAAKKNIIFTCNSPDAYPSYDASQEQGDSSGEDAHS